MSRIRVSRCAVHLVTLAALLFLMGASESAWAADEETPSKTVAVKVSRNYLTSELLLHLEDFEVYSSETRTVAPTPMWVVLDSAGREIGAGTFEYG